MKKVVYLKLKILKKEIIKSIFIKEIPIWTGIKLKPRRSKFPEAIQIVEELRKHLD